MKYYHDFIAAQNIFLMGLFEVLTVCRFDLHISVYTLEFHQVVYLCFIY